MLWIKSLHIIFVVAWFAGLFYLPRLFVYHADASDPISHERFVLMERRLLILTNLAAVLALVFGGMLAGIWLKAGWMHAKLALVLVLLGYHHSLGKLARAFRERRNTRSSKWFRVYNEMPTLLLIAIVILVTVKPF